MTDHKASTPAAPPLDSPPSASADSGSHPLLSAPPVTSVDAELQPANPSTRPSVATTAIEALADGIRSALNAGCGEHRTCGCTRFGKTEATN